MRTILLLTATLATAVFGVPTFQGQLHGSAPLGFGSAVATDGYNMVASSFTTLDFYQWDGATWRFVSHIDVGANSTGLAIYKTSALAKTADTVYAFELQGGVWNMTQKIAISDGNNLYFGRSVALFSNTAAIGAPNHASGRGFVYVLSRTGAGAPWSVVQGIASPTTSADYFGGVVALGGVGTTHYLLASAPYANGAKGVVYGYQQNGVVFAGAGVIQSPTSGVGRFGESMAGEAGTILIGAPADAGFVGSAYVYVISFNSGLMSSYRAQIIPAVSGATFLFGEGVAFNSGYAIISSRSTITYYPVTGGYLGTAWPMFVPSYSGIWGTAVVSVSGFTFAGDANANGGAGAVSWYR